MKITFITHSSFSVELERNILVFDFYDEGNLPVFPKDKRLWFLASHGHYDHFNREILKLRQTYPLAEYILSRDIRLRAEEKTDWIHRVRAREESDFGDLHVRTLRSTDQGVAFVVEAEGRRIYHAGDLNWWHWEGESDAWNRNMAVNYQREIDCLADMQFDVAFVPLDPRLESAYFLGIKYFLEKTQAQAVFPMHCWKDYSVCARALAQPELQGLLKHFHALEYEGQEWNLC